MTKIKASCSAAIVALVVLLSLKTADAQESHSKVLEKYMSSDVVGVFYVDLDKLDLEALIRNATKLGFREKDELADLLEAMPVVTEEIARLKRAGISRAYALLRSSDIQSQATSWVMPLQPGSDSDSAKEVFANAMPMFRQHFLAEIEATEGAVLAASTRFQLDQLTDHRPIDSTAHQAMWDELGNGAIGLVLFFDHDARRVIRELMPPLPTPFDSITGELIADELAWGGAELSLGETPNLKIEIQMNHEEAAKTIEQSLVQSYEFLKQLPFTKQYIPEREFGFVFDGLKPACQASRVTVSTNQLTADLDRLGKILAPQVKMARVEAAKTQRLNTLRQFALGIHNFESAYKHFPAQAKVDQKGEPLLSWRVQILPFIGEEDLWRQFHHDEPWDSEHNVKLVEQMPKIFADSGPESRQNNKTGKTIYLGVAGEGMIFDGGKEIGFRDLKDGSSNTILLVAASRNHAVPWTQPTDWQVDLNNPTAQLQEQGRTEVEIAIADGSTHRIPISTATKTWQGLVQIDDGEIVEWPR